MEAEAAASERVEAEPGGALVGRAVFAKCRGFPWWPAQVLSAHAGHHAPRKPGANAVLVHFFGTFDVAWVAGPHLLVPLAEGLAAHGGCKQRVFRKGLEEAETFVRTGLLPLSMTDPLAAKELAAAEKQEKERAKYHERAERLKRQRAAEEPPAAPPPPPPVRRKVKVGRMLGLLPPAQQAASAGRASS